MSDEWERENAPTIGYYAMFEYTNGFKKAMYWSKEKMLAHADKYSKAFHVKAVENRNPKYSRVSYEDFLAGKYPEGDAWKYSSFWYKDFDGMAYKTMLRQLISKWGIMSIDLIQAIDADMAVIREDGTADYVEMEETVQADVVSDQDLEEAQEETPVQESAEAPETSVENDFFNQ